MKMKIFSLLLSLLLLLPLMATPVSALTPTQAADVDGDGTVTARDAAILVRFSAGWDGYVDDFGNLTYPWKTSSYIKSFDPAHPVSFGGRTFRILSFAGVKDKVEIGNTHFSTKDVSPWIVGSDTDIGSDTGKGNAQFYTWLQEDVLARNTYLEETYNCKIEEVRDPVPYTALQDDVLSGAGEYDLALCRLSNLNSESTKGYMENLLAIPTLDLSSPWFDQKQIGALTFDGSLYYLTGASDTALYQSVFLPLIGVSNVRLSCGSTYTIGDKTYTLNDNQAAAEMIYDLVLNGKWTIQNALKIVTDCYESYNGSGNHYGITAETHSNLFHMIGAGFTAAYLKNGEYAYHSSFTDCTNYAAWEALKPLLAPGDNSVNRRYLGTGNTWLSGTTSKTVIRSSGNTNYFMNTDYNNATYWGAFLPYPKLNEADEYRTSPNIGFSYLYVIPASVRVSPDAVSFGFENGTDMAGYFLSAYFEASLNHTGKTDSDGNPYSIRESYLRALANKAVFHNGDLKGETRMEDGLAYRALKLIFDALYIDPGYVLSTTMYSKFSSCGNNKNSPKGVDNNSESSQIGDFTGKWETLATDYNSSVSTQNNYLGYYHAFLSMDAA